MGELGLNKIFGALLAVALVIMGLRELSTIVFGGGHGPAHEYESVNQWAAESFHGYRIAIAETGGGADVVEEIYDLGLLLASADVTRGERSFKGKCASCHTIEQGGATGTGPNLFASIGSAKQSHGNFAYSGALAPTEGDWTYANMDAWLAAPSKYARGTSMGFAGLKRDDERANVLAYLASYTPDAPAFPAPLPVAEEDAAETLDTPIEGRVEGPVEVPVEIEIIAPLSPVDDGAGTGDLIEDAEDVVETLPGTVEDATEAIEDAAETPEN